MIAVRAFVLFVACHFFQIVSFNCLPQSRLHWQPEAQGEDTTRDADQKLHGDRSVVMQFLVKKAYATSCCRMMQCILMHIAAVENELASSYNSCAPGLTKQGSVLLL